MLLGQFEKLWSLMNIKFWIMISNLVYDEKSLLSEFTLHKTGFKPDQDDLVTK